MELLQFVQKGLPDDLPSDARLLVALSGGADSVCLLLALSQLGYRVEALHCNFELRGSESDADEAFCRRLCRTKSIPISVRHFRTRSYAQRHAMSLEMAARRLRYDWFADMALERSAAAVCVAHHRDDNIETMLLNLIRGTGIRGITGMNPRSVQDGMIVLRPMLSLSRTDIESWLRACGQSWVTDSTNLKADAAQRNLIRLRVLPLLEEMNPRVRETLAEDILRFREVEALYSAAVDKELSQVVVGNEADVARIHDSTSPRTLLQEWLYNIGFNSAQINDIYEGLDGDSGRVWQSGTHRLLRDRGRLILQKKEKSPSQGNPTSRMIQNKFVVAGEVVLPLDGLFTASSDVRLLIRRQAVSSSDFVIPRDCRSACFDLEKLELPLIIRRLREGDRMQPFGFEGTRLVSDILTDRKLSLFEKERQLVVLSGERIVWIVGQRASAGFEVDESTRHVMTITML